MSTDLEEELNMLRKDSSLKEVQEPRGGNKFGMFRVQKVQNACSVERLQKKSERQASGQNMESL